MPHEQPEVVCDHVTPDEALPYERLFPDYLNDLNATAQAEALLKEEQKQDYCSTLCCVIQGYPVPDKTWINSPNSSRVMSVFASAAQRSDALVKFIGKWTE
jgi:hypothetical protein